MRTWDMHEVAAQLGQLLDDARHRGPQVIRRDGRRVAAIIGYEDFVQLAQADGLVRHFQSASVMGIDLEMVRARSIRIDHGRCYVELTDGREVGVPVDWYEFLRDASTEAREGWVVDPGGTGIYWPQLQNWLEVVLLLDLRRLPVSGQ